MYASYCKHWTRNATKRGTFQRIRIIIKYYLFAIAIATGSINLNLRSKKVHSKLYSKLYAWSPKKYKQAGG